MSETKTEKSNPPKKRNLKKPVNKNQNKSENLNKRVSISFGQPLIFSIEIKEEKKER